MISTRKEAIKKGLEILNRNDIRKLKELGDWLDDDLVMATLIKKDVYAYRYASKRLRSRKDLALYVLKIDGILLDSVEGDLNDDKDVVLTAVRNYGLALKSATQRLKQDKKVVVEAVNREPRALMYACKEFRKNLALINYAFSISGPFIVEPNALLALTRVDSRVSARWYPSLKEDKVIILARKLYENTITGQEVLVLQNMLLELSNKKECYLD